MIHNPIRKALPDLSNPGVADDLRSGKQLVGADGSIVTGTLPEVIQATPTISVSSGGLITASATQGGGIVADGTKSATQQLTTQGAKTVTPGTSTQTAVTSGRYTTGTVQVAGDANLKPENIAEGVSIFGVMGTHGGEFVTGTFKSGSYYPEILYPTQKESEGYSYAIVGMGASIIIDEQIPKYSLVFADPGDKLTISGGITRVNTNNFVGQDVNFFFVSGDFTIEG